MAVPKLFYFPSSGRGQLKYLRSRVRPRKWMQDSSMDDMRFCCSCCVATGLGEVEGVAIEGYTAFVASQAMEKAYAMQVYHYSSIISISWNTHKDQ